jgi:hypothetical protein
VNLTLQQGNVAPLVNTSSIGSMGSGGGGGDALVMGTIPENSGVGTLVTLGAELAERMDPERNVYVAEIPVWLDEEELLQNCACLPAVSSAGKLFLRAYSSMRYCSGKRPSTASSL